MDKNFKINIWLQYLARGQIFSSIRPSASTECKNAPSIIHWHINVSIDISSVVEFQRWWVLKSKIFGQESTFLKGKKNSVKNWA